MVNKNSSGYPIWYNIIAIYFLKRLPVLPVLFCFKKSMFNGIVVWSR